jgi:hypothetical protein
LGLKDVRVVCYDGVTNEELGDYTAIAQALDTARRQAEAEKARADAEKARADDLEARLRHVEAQLRARNGTPGTS